MPDPRDSALRRIRASHTAPEAASESNYAQMRRLRKSGLSGGRVSDVAFLEHLARRDCNRPPDHAMILQMSHHGKFLS